MAPASQMAAQSQMGIVVLPDRSVPLAEATPRGAARSSKSMGMLKLAPKIKAPQPQQPRVPSPQPPSPEPRLHPARDGSHRIGADVTRRRMGRLAASMLKVCAWTATGHSAALPPTTHVTFVALASQVPRPGQAATVALRSSGATSAVGMLHGARAGVGGWTLRSRCGCRRARMGRRSSLCGLRRWTRHSCAPWEARFPW